MKEWMLEELSGPEKKKYMRTLNNNHLMRIRVYMYNKDEHLIEELNSGRYSLIDGQVDVDSTDSSSPARVLNLTIFLQQTQEFREAVEFGPFHPAKFLEVVYCIFVPGLGDDEGEWVGATCFYGTANKLEYDELTETLVIEGFSKESLLLAPNRAHRTESNILNVNNHKTLQLDDFIRKIAANHGERKFKLAKCGKGDRVHINKKKFDEAIADVGIWPYMVDAAKQKGFFLYYARDGYLTLRRMPNKRVQSFRRNVTKQWTFVARNHEKDGVVWQSNVTTLPTMIWNQEFYRNRVDVYGKKTKNAKSTSLRYSMIYDNPGVFGSTIDLARNGVRRELVEVMEQDGVISKENARDLATRNLQYNQYMAQEAEFECLPVPHMEINIFCRLTDSSYAANVFYPTVWSLPLTPGPLMTMGFNWRMHVLGRWRRRLNQRHTRVSGR